MASWPGKPTVPQRSKSAHPAHQLAAMHAAGPQTPAAGGGIAAMQHLTTCQVNPRACALPQVLIRAVLACTVSCCALS